MTSSFSGSYREIIDNMGLALAIYRAVDDGDDFMFVEVNAGVEKIEQIKREGLIGRKVTEAFPGVEEFGLLDVFRRVYLTGVPERFPISMYTDNRITGWRDNYVYRLDTGEVIAVYKDETIRKMQEEHINYLYQVLLAIRNVNQLIITEKDMDVLLQRSCEVMVETKGYNGAWVGLTGSTGKVVSVYGAGFDADQFTKFKSMFDKSDIPCLFHVGQPGAHVVEDVSSTCTGCPLQVDDLDSHVLYASLMHEDRLFGVMMASVPVGMTEQEELDLFQEVVDDISYALYGLENEEERARVEESLRVSEAKYRSFLDESRDGVTVNVLSELVYVNPRFSEMMGYSVEELIGSSILDHHAPKYRDMIRDRTRRRSNGEDVPSQYEVELIKKDGSLIPVSYSVSRIIYEGKPSSLTFIRDITERRQMEMDIGLVNLLNTAVNRGDELQEILNQLAEETKKIFRGYGSSVYLINDDRTHLVLQSYYLPEGVVGVIERLIGERIPQVRIPLEPGGLYQEVVEMGEPRLFNDAASIRRLMEECTGNVVLRRIVPVVYDAWGIESVMMAPLVSEGVCLGLIDIAGKDHYREQDLVRLGRIATQVTGVIRRKQLDANLLESEEKFRGFMQSATDLFVMFDEELRYVEVNNSWLQYTGLEKEDVIGKHALEVFPRLKETGRYDAYLKVLETGEPVEFIAVEAMSKPGMVLDYSVFKSGNVLGVAGRDVSDRVLYRRRLELLHGHAASMSQAESIKEVSEITRESLINVLGFNRGSLGLVEGSVLNHQYRWGIDSSEEFRMPLDGPGLTVKVVNSGESIRIGNVSETGLYVNGVGDPVTFSELAVPIIVSGNVVGVINIESKARDAFSEDDQRLVETLASHVASAYSKIKYNERLNALHSFTFELDLVESVEDVVETSFRIMMEVLGFQFSSFQLLEDEGLVTVGINGRPSLDMVLPLTGKGITTRAAREAHTVRLGDVRDDPDFIKGSTDSRSELAVPILVEEGVLGVLNVESLLLDAFSEEDARLMEILAQNVGSALNRLRIAEEKVGLERQVFAEQVRVEQEQELSKMKTRFMSTATHELRTPLTSIQGYTDLIQVDQENLSESQRQYFTVIQRNVQRLTKLTDDLLNQQRLEEGRLTVNLEPVNLVDLFEDIRSEFTPILEGKNQLLVVNCVEAVVTMDRLRLMQVLVNLLSNASKFSPDGAEIVVDVVDTGDGVQFSVSDNGVGISEEDIGKLFKPFPGILVEGNVSGTGLGLSISRGIVELHGGTIWVESGGLGKGSRFSFTIPISE